MATSPTGAHVPLHRTSLLQDGVTDSVIRTMRRGGGLVTVRPGTYIGISTWAATAAAEQHRLLIHATVSRLTPGGAVSHLSAAVLHGMPVLGRPPTRVHITRDGQGGGFSRGQIHTHVTSLADDAVVVVDECAATSAARTVFDVACTSGLHQGLCLADNALHRRLLNREALADQVSGSGRRRGLAVARRVVELADGGSESPGETLSRLRLRSAGIPEPELQYAVHGPDGFIGRADFAWKDHRVLGEFDGEVKYRDLAPTDGALRAVLLQERQREQQLRDQGWDVIRWGWRDLDDPVCLGARVRAAFARHRQRTT